MISTDNRIPIDVEMIILDGTLDLLCLASDLLAPARARGRRPSRETEIRSVVQETTYLTNLRGGKSSSSIENKVLQIHPDSRGSAGPSGLTGQSFNRRSDPIPKVNQS